MQEEDLWSSVSFYKKKLDETVLSHFLVMGYATNFPLESGWSFIVQRMDITFPIPVF